MTRQKQAKTLSPGIWSRRQYIRTPVRSIGWWQWDVKSEFTPPFRAAIAAPGNARDIYLTYEPLPLTIADYGLGTENVGQKP